MNTIRIAYSNEAYAEFLDDRKRALLRLEGKLDEHYSYAWEEFKIKGRG